LTEAPAILTIRDLETGYGKKQVLFGISIEVHPGEIVALIGPNGAGKSTVMKAVCGLIPVWKGEIVYDEMPLNGATPAQNVRRGITLAPQGNRVFDELSVMENLEVGGYRLPRRELKPRIEEVLEIFPVLSDRARQNAGKLSGGEQQMLSIARALVPKPRLLMLDEPSLGLQPNLVEKVFEKIIQVNHDTGVTILIVEQKVREVLEFSSRVYSMKLGKIAFSSASVELRQDRERLKQLFL
jgi:branched-chain amino acid transport system ATP-binding protein